MCHARFLFHSILIPLKKKSAGCNSLNWRHKPLIDGTCRAGRGGGENRPRLCLHLANPTSLDFTFQVTHSMASQVRTGPFIHPQKIFIENQLCAWRVSWFCWRESSKSRKTATAGSRTDGRHQTFKQRSIFRRWLVSLNQCSSIITLTNMFGRRRDMSGFLHSTLFLFPRHPALGLAL